MARCDRGGRQSRAVWIGGPRVNIEDVRPLRIQAGGGDDEDPGVCGAPDLRGDVVMFLQIKNLPGLIADLESDPFVGHLLYGMSNHDDSSN